jgi:uncharacterized protein (TIRG00374 family)
LKNFILNFLRIAIPVGFGIYLAWYFWSSMPQKDKDQVWNIFSRFNYLFILLSLIFCWISHYSRAIRWSYMLESLGYKTNKWNNYHAVITGYFMNMLLPRAGEISRAGIITKYEKVPFEKAFGTIIAERVIDLIIMVTLAIITLWLQGEKYPLMMEKYNELNATFKTNSGSLGTYIFIGMGLIGLVCAVLYFKNEKFRTKINSLFRGLIRLKKRWQFLGHTLLIWTMYLSLYWVVFLGIPETSTISPNGMLLGFLAGGISIILVPGGIGIYPVFVAAALSFYFSDYALLYGLGWLAWIAQTTLIVIAGVISLYFVPKLNAAK